MSKKTLYIILISIIVLAGIGWLVWYFLLKPQETAAPKSSTNFTITGQPVKGTEFKAISEGPVISLRQNNGTILFYDFSSQLWQLNENDAKPTLTNQTPQNISAIIWPTIFSPDGKKIVYQNSKSNGLFVSDSNNKNQKTLISDLKLKDIILKWPSANNIAIVSKPSGKIAGNLWFLDTRSLVISKIINNLFGLEALFSQNNNSFIYSYTDQNGKNLKLAVYDKKGESKVINNISTLVDKCTWAKDQISIFCAVPKSWPDFAVLPDDYYKNTFLTNDDIWKINTETGEKTLVLENAGSVSSPAISDDESAFFFISKENQFLYKLNLR